MNDMAYIVSRTLEDKIAIAENTDQSTLLVTLGALKEILALLKEQNDCENCAIAIEDRQPVVRCKDCRYWTSEKIFEYHICKRWEKTGVKNFATAWNWFCADGEPKEGR